MKLLMSLLGGLAGATIGLLAGTVGTFVVCGLLGEGFAQVGWIYVFFTAPLGLFLGLCLGIFLTSGSWKKERKTPQENRES